MFGVRVLLLHPEIAIRSCSDCKRWMYDDRPGSMGEVRRDSNGIPYPRIGRTPCSYCPKQPSHVPINLRSPATGIELSEKNWLAYQHYQECRATGQFPIDWIVKQNAAAIRQAEEAVAQVRQIQLALLRAQS